MNTRTYTKSAETFITHRGHQTKFQTSGYNGHLPSLPRRDKYLLRIKFKFPLHIFFPRSCSFSTIHDLFVTVLVSPDISKLFTPVSIYDSTKRSYESGCCCGGRHHTKVDENWSHLSVTPTVITRKKINQRLRRSVRVFAKEHGSRSAKVWLRKPACRAVIFVVSSVCTDRYRNSTVCYMHFLPDPKQCLRCHSKKTTISLSEATKACCF